MALSLEFGRSSGHRLLESGLHVGWLAGDKLRFIGFETLVDAERAGDAGYVALLQWLASHQREVHESIPALHVALRQDGRSEWIGPNGRALARMLGPDEGDRFSIEFTLPERLHTAAAAHAASHVYDAIAGSTAADFRNARRMMPSRD